MIRIDLGKEELIREESKPVHPLIEKLGLFKKKEPKNSKPKDVLGMVILLSASAFACLPYLFVQQYRDYYISQNAAAGKETIQAIEALKQDIGRFSAFQKDLESFDQQKKVAGERLKTIRELLQARGTPVAVLDAIGQSLPTRAWLTSLEVGTNPSPTVSLQGSAYTNEDVSEFAEKLSESIYLSNVQLEEVRGLASGNTAETRNFTVKAVPKGFTLPKGNPPGAVSQSGVPAPATPQPASPQGAK